MPSTKIYSSEEVAEINKTYYDSHRDKVCAYQRKPCFCDCGAFICYGALRMHKKSKKHYKIMSKMKI
jgi:hypothetical protein